MSKYITKFILYKRIILTFLTLFLPKINILKSLQKQLTEKLSQLYPQYKTNSLNLF